MNGNRGKIMLGLGVFLLSCGSPSSPNMDSPLLFRNGDIIDMDASTASYSSVCVIDDSTKVIERLHDGETVYLVIAAGDCGHCLELQPKFCNAVISAGIEAYMFHAETLATSSIVAAYLDRIETEFPDLKGAFVRRFPYSFLITPKYLTVLPFNNHSGTSGAVLSYLNENMHHENLIRFHNKNNFVSYLSKNKSRGYVYQNSLKTFNAEHRDSIKGDFALLEDPNLEEGFYEVKDGSLVKA